MGNSSAKKVLIMEVTEEESTDFGKYRYYSRDVAICNIAITVGVYPEVNMNDSEVLPADNCGYFLVWDGTKETTLTHNLTLYFDEVYNVKDVGWSFDYLGENDKYIQYIIDHKDELGISEFFD